MALVQEKFANMRAKQIWRWLYFHGFDDFKNMTNMSLELRSKLNEIFCLKRPEIIEKDIAEDGVRKYLIRFEKGSEAETVFIPAVSKTGALCISSQIGCTLKLSFLPYRNTKISTEF